MYRLRRNKTRLKLLAVLLAVAMLASLAPLSGVFLPKASAAVEIKYKAHGQQDSSERPTSLQAGQVYAGKIVTPDDNVTTNHRFNITLEALAGENKTQQQTKYDVVFLLDASYSMDQYRESLATAANNAISHLLSANENGQEINRVFVYKFSDMATALTSGWQTRHVRLSKDDLKGAYATNIQDALLKAYLLLKDENNRRKDAIPVIILMSDGAPNRYITSIFSETPSIPSSNDYRDDGGNDGGNTAAAYTLLYAKWVKEHLTKLLEKDKITPRIYTVGFRLNEIPTRNNERARAYAVLDPKGHTIPSSVPLGTAKNVTKYTPSPDPNNYVYNDDYFSASDEDGLKDALKAIVDTITNPVIDGHLKFTDHVGNQFEFVTSGDNDEIIAFKLDGATVEAELQDDGTYVWINGNNTVTVTFNPGAKTVKYEIAANELNTVDPDAQGTNFNNDALYDSITFPVKIRSGYGADTYYTNYTDYDDYDVEEAEEAGEGCVVDFEPAQENLYYKVSGNPQPPFFLPATGWIEFEEVAPPPPPTTDVIIKKTAVGGDPDKRFTFSVNIQDEGVTATIYRNGQPSDETVNLSNVELGTGDELRLNNVTVGTQFTVTEKVPSGYTAKVSAQNASLTVTTVGGTVQAAVTVGQKPVITFTNTYDTGTLTLQKIKRGKSPTEDPFQFEIVLDYPEGAYTAGVRAKIKPRGGEAYTPDWGLENDPTALYVDLSHKDSVTFYNLPYGTKYTIKEAHDGLADVTYSIVTGLRSGTSGTGLTASGTIGSACASVTFTNDYTGLASLKVFKEVIDDNNPDAPDSFDFDLYLYTVELKEQPAPESFPVAAESFGPIEGSGGVLRSFLVAAAGEPAPVNENGGAPDENPGQQPDAPVAPSGEEGGNPGDTGGADTGPGAPDTTPGPDNGEGGPDNGTIDPGSAGNPGGDEPGADTGSPDGDEPGGAPGSDNPGEIGGDDGSETGPQNPNTPSEPVEEEVPYVMPVVPDGLTPVDGLPGHYTFTLNEDNEYGMVIPYLPRGTRFIITERPSVKPRATLISSPRDEIDFDTSSDTPWASGEIDKNGVVVKFTNDYSITPGILMIDKIYDGLNWRVPYSSKFRVLFDRDVEYWDIFEPDLSSEYEPEIGKEFEIEVGILTVSFRNVFPGTSFTIEEIFDENTVTPEKITYSVFHSDEEEAKETGEGPTYSGAMPAKDEGGYEGDVVTVSFLNEYSWPEISVTKLANGGKNIKVNAGSVVEYSVDITYPDPDMVHHIIFEDSILSDSILSGCLDRDNVRVTSANDAYPVYNVNWIAEPGKEYLRIDLNQPEVFALFSEEESEAGAETNTITVRYTVDYPSNYLDSYNNTAAVTVYYGWEENDGLYGCSDSDDALVSFRQIIPPDPDPEPPVTPTPEPPEPEPPTPEPPEPEPPAPEPPEPPAPEPPEEEGEILGEREEGPVSGAVEKLPQTGGVSLSTLLGIIGAILLFFGLTIAAGSSLYRRKRQK